MNLNDVRFRNIADIGHRIVPIMCDAIDPQRHWRANFAVTHNAALW